MEITAKLKEVKEFQYGTNKEKTGYNLITADQGQVTTFSTTILDEARAAILDEKERKIEFTEKPSTNPAYPPLRTVTTIYDTNGKAIESSKAGGGGGRVAKADPVKTASIERQNAMNSAVHLYTEFKPDGDKINPDELIAYAETILAWTSKKGA